MCGLRIGSFTLTPAVILQLTCVELFGGSMKWDKKESSFVSQIDLRRGGGQSESRPDFRRNEPVFGRGLGLIFGGRFSGIHKIRGRQR